MLIVLILFWQFDNTVAKLTDISKEVSSTIREQCNCDFQDNHIFNGEFNCISDFPNQVLYRAKLRGLSPDDCTSFISLLTAWAQAMTTSATIVVLGNRLSVAPNCAVEINTFGDILECPTPPSTVASGGISDSQTTVIGAGVGAAAGVTVIVILVVIFIVALVLVSRRKKKTNL